MKQKFKISIIRRGDMFQAIAESPEMIIHGPLRFTLKGAKSAIKRERLNAIAARH